MEHVMCNKSCLYCVFCLRHKDYWISFLHSPNDSYWGNKEYNLTKKEISELKKGTASFLSEDSCWKEQWNADCNTEILKTLKSHRCKFFYPLNKKGEKTLPACNEEVLYKLDNKKFWKGIVYGAVATLCVSFVLFICEKFFYNFILIKNISLTINSNFCSEYDAR